MMRALNAAVLRHDDRRAAHSARAVPAKAKIIKFGDVVVGYWHRTAKTRRFSFDSLRVREIESTALRRYQNAPPMPDDARAFARAIADHASKEAAVRWIDTWCVTLDDDERAEIVAASSTKKTFWTADALAKLLGVTREERDALGLSTIGAIDFSKRDRIIARKVSARERMRAARAAAQPIREISQEKAAPWRDAGVSRRTWFRKKKASCNVAGHGTEPVLTHVVRGVRTKSVPSVATLSATSADRVLQAIRDDGPVNVAAIIERTGLHHRIVRPLLCRLLQAQRIVRVSRGVYRTAEPEGIATAQRKSPARPAPSQLPNQRSAQTRVIGLGTAIESTPRPVRFFPRPLGGAGRCTPRSENILKFTNPHFRFRVRRADQGGLI